MSDMHHLRLYNWSKVEVVQNMSCKSIDFQVWLVFYTLLPVLSLVVIIVWSFPEHTQCTALRDTNIACSFFFLFELLIRFATCPEKHRFFCCFFNIIDILHILPMFIYCCMTLAIDEEDVARWVTDLGIALLAISTFLRAVCVLKIGSLSCKMQVLLLALRASAKELLMFLLLESVFMVAFGSAIFFAEQKAEYQHIESIAHGMWMSIITLTTVGYGDYFPKTAGGKVASGACALSGIVLIALTVSIVANNFRQIYASTEVRMRLNQWAIDKKMENIYQLTV